MEKTAYVIFSIIAIGWILAIITGLIMAFPVGLIGLVIIFGIGLLLIKVIRERMNSTEDNYYSKNVEK